MQVQQMRTRDAYVETLLNHFYCARFNAIIQENAARQGDVSAEAQGIEVNALMELHEVERAKALLGSLCTPKTLTEDPSLDYFRGRFHYLLGDFAAAETLFARITETADDPTLCLRGFLGLANIAYATEHYERAYALVERIESHVPPEFPEDRICLLHLKANIDVAASRVGEHTNQYGLAALKIAGMQAWTYWINRSLLVAARVLHKLEKAAELQQTLTLLKALVEDSECLLLAHDINETFPESDQVISQELEIDLAEMRLYVYGKWVPMADKPLLFSLIQCLLTKESFVGKAAVAKHLWPEESYNPLIHDRRIFNLVNRMRSFLEKFPEQPIVLLSGRQGYKLAVRRSETSKDPAFSLGA